VTVEQNDLLTPTERCHVEWYRSGYDNQYEMCSAEDADKLIAIIDRIAPKTCAMSPLEATIEEMHALLEAKPIVEVRRSSPKASELISALLSETNRLRAMLKEKT
jgi:hypothetical protein